MNRMKPTILFLVAAVFFGVLKVHAQSNKDLQPKKVTQKAVSAQSKNKVQRVNSPERSTFEGPTLGYKMVTEVLDVFGGESESDNYKIPVNSGGQSSPIGISESDSSIVKTGYVHAAFVLYGDVDEDGIIDVSDVVYLAHYLFLDEPGPIPMEVGDVNCDGIVNIGDIVYLLNYVYLDGPPPCTS